MATVFWNVHIDVSEEYYAQDNILYLSIQNKQTNSVVSVRKANYTDQAAAACRRS
jgi:hypothetical protein